MIDKKQHGIYTNTISGIPCCFVFISRDPAQKEKEESVSFAERRNIIMKKKLCRKTVCGWLALSMVVTGMGSGMLAFHTEDGQG